MRFFSHRNLGFQVVIVTMIILLIPILVLLYDSVYASKKEEITFKTEEERLGTIVQTLYLKVTSEINNNKDKISQMTVEQRNEYFEEIFSHAAEPLVDLNPGVRLSLYMPETSEIIVEGFLHNYRKLTPEEQKMREERIYKNTQAGIRSVLANGEPLATIAGDPDDRFIERFIPVKIDEKVVAVIWGDERLHPIFSQAQQFRAMTRYLSMAAIFIGGIGVFTIVYNLTRGVRKIKDGLGQLEKDINAKLPQLPGELGQISKAINKMADALREKEKLEEEMRKQERLAALGQVVTGVAHELRNPIGVIKTTVQLMESEINDDNKTEYFEVIKQQVDRQNRVIQELLSYGRPSKPVKEMVNINKLMDSVLTFMVAQLRQNNIKLNTNYALTLPSIYADAERIKQVFVNVILNAIESMPDGGKLDITTTYDNRNVIIIFKDNGVGMEEGQLKQIFDPFYTTKKTGSGLGLTICNQILSMHDGTIEARCNEDRGMTFIVKLPIKNQQGGIIE